MNGYVFGTVAVGASPEAKPLLDAENAKRRQESKGKKQLGILREVYIGGKGQRLADPDSRKPLPPQALGGPVLRLKSGDDPRRLLCDWLCSSQNPFFAKSVVNRVWAHYLGIGLVEPVDNFSQANPPSNDRLLGALAQDFADSGFDFRHLERTILQSSVYQLSSQTNASNRLDRTNYSHAYVRPLMAEVVVDVLDSALGVVENFKADGPPGCRAVEIGASRVQNGNLAFALRVFGRPPRTSACDCERGMEPALPQTLYRMTDTDLLSKLKRGRLASLMKSQLPDAAVLDELFLATLSRWPTAAERQAFATHRAHQPDRFTALTDTLWALINTREFLLNH